MHLHNEKNVIYDFETLSQRGYDGPILGFALMTYDEDQEYTYEELCDKAHFIKFNVNEQINKGLKIDPETFKWWREMDGAASKILEPSTEDKSYSTLYDWILERCDPSRIKKTYTRGNTFDPVFLDWRLRDFGHEDPFDWWTIRDTRSYIEGMLLGSDIKYHGFVPDDVKDKFIAHDPKHDIAMDVYRMQSLRKAIL